MKITKNAKVVADVDSDKKELVDIAIKEAKDHLNEAKDSLLYVVKHSDDKATLDRAKHVLSELLPLKFVLD